MTNAPPSPGTASALTAWAAGFFAVFALFWVPVAFQFSSPPRQEPALPYAWALSLFAVALALFAVWKAQSSWSKLLALSAVALSGVCNVLFVLGWSVNYSADALPGLVGLTMLIGVGSWLVRQRAVAIGTSAIFLFGVGPGFLPGRDEATVKRMVSGRGSRAGVGTERRKAKDSN